ALTDEYDEMLANVKGQGDPLGLIDARGDTYQDFVNLITSTPSVGVSEVTHDSKSGLEFWKYQKPEDITSPIWRLFQEGTQYHWAVPCPECNEYFIPRFKQLRWAKDATAREARTDAYLECPRCGGVMENEHKAEANARGVYVAPGQWVTKGGEVEGDLPEADSYSFWVSGIMSPFRSFGDRAASFITASTMQDQEKIQTAINAGFGELFSVGGGDVMEWQAVAERRDEKLGIDEVPEDAALLTCGVDVQGDRLVYTIRAWGFRYTTWLIRHEEIWGSPDQDDIWDELEAELTSSIDGRRVSLALVDSGYKSSRVYEFARRMGKRVRATKGKDTATKPFQKTLIDVTVGGKLQKFGQALWHINTDFFKSFVHGRLERDLRKPGGWHVPAAVDDEYFKQLVSERRITTPSGKPKWQALRSDNHYFDCEVLNSAAAHMLKVGRIKENYRAPIEPDDEQEQPERPVKKKRSLAELSKRLNG
ncbi:MAG: terminase gpA endonuclease subunit, partial [Hyphomicrobiales bacterium]